MRIELKNYFNAVDYRCNNYKFFSLFPGVLGYKLDKGYAYKYRLTLTWLFFCVHFDFVEN